MKINKRTFLKSTAALALTPLIPFQLEETLTYQDVAEISKKYLSERFDNWESYLRDNYRKSFLIEHLKTCGIETKSQLINAIKKHYSNVVKDEEEKPLYSIIKNNVPFKYFQSGFLITIARLNKFNQYESLPISTNDNTV